MGQRTWLVILYACAGCEATLDPGRNSNEPVSVEMEPEVEVDPPLPVDDEEMTPSPACVGAAAPLRRLTRQELELALSAALRVPVEAARALPPDETVGPFAANSSLPPSESWTRTIMELAERTARRVPRERLSCDQPDCFEGTLQNLVQPLWRRDLAPEDENVLRELWARGRELTGTSTGAWTLIVEAAIQSPDFLYRLESPSLTPNELANRLAFFLWAEGPDARLWAASEAGGLSTRAGLEEEIDRMLDDPRAARLSERFVTGWLDLSRLTEVPKHFSFLRFDAEARAAMKDETIRFFDAIARRSEGNLHTLMTAEWTLLDRALLPIYGLAVPDDFDPERPITLPEGQRYGILSHPSVMTVHSTSKESSPIARGSMILDNLLCIHIELPDIEIPELPEPTPGQSKRERLAAHNSEPACAACHQFIDPIGFSFEALDAIGQYQSEDAEGRPIDDQGALSVGSPSDGPATGVQALSERIMQTPDFTECFVRQWMRLGFGRPATQEDACVLERLTESFVDANHDMRTLITELAMSPSFSGLPEEPRP